MLALIEVDVPDTRESREWLRAYARDVLRERFQQRAIYLKFVGPVEHLVVTESKEGDAAFVWVRDLMLRSGRIQPAFWVRMETRRRLNPHRAVEEASA